MGDRREAATEVGAIIHAARSAAQLTRQLLAFGRREVEPHARVEAARHLAAVAAMVRKVAREDVRLHLDLPAGPTWVEMSPGRLEQVVLNLVTNALDAVGPGGTVELGARREGDDLVLWVADDGVGMDEDTLRRVFEPFFTTKPRGVGTGLGLASVYGAVQAVGGRIDVRSAPGRGTRFTIRLPTIEPPAEAEPPDPVLRAVRPARILLVEDHASLRRLVARTLQKDRHTVQAVGSLAELEAILDEGFAPDLVLTDLVLPDGGGAQVVRLARRLAPSALVVLMSGYAPEDAREPELARLPFLAKPFTPQELRDRIRLLLRGSW